MQKVLIIGLGSIGQRHAKALLDIGVKKISALRTGKGAKAIDKDISQKITMFYNEEEAFNWEPTHIIISNPTSMHAYYIEKAIKFNTSYFVEKPISDKLDEVVTYTQKGKGIVGYNLRFHGIFSFIKQKIESGEYGKIITATLRVGHYLPDWHPYEDYRKAYYSNKNLGGGALRTLSHEIDLAQFFFGRITSVYARIEKLSQLEIDVDDVSNIICETQTCKQVNIHQNFIDPLLKREGSVHFERGLLEYDFVKGVVYFTSYENKKTETVYEKNEDYNQQYIMQMKSFLEPREKSYSCSIAEGINVMKVINKCEESTKLNKAVCLD